MPTEERNEWELSEVDIKASHEKYVYWVTTTELPFCSTEKKNAGWNKQKSLQPLCEREQNPLKVEEYFPGCGL